MTAPDSPRPLTLRRGWRAGVLTAALAVVVALIGFAVTRPAEAGTVGAGSYADTLPAGRSTPTGCGSIATNPRQWVTSGAPSGPVPTNDWWSSILFKRTDCAFGEPLYAHPLAFDTYADGLGFSYTTTPTITGSATGVGEYHYPYVQDLRVGPAGLNSPDVKVDDWTDWTVTPYWSDGARTMRATIGHGLPFAYFQITGGPARIATSGPPSVWSNSGATIGFTVNGHDYVAYAPSGSTWTVSGTLISSNLNGQDFFSVAVLPTTPGTPVATRSSLAATYGTYAHAHVTGTTVSYEYAPATGTVTTTYSFTTTARQGSATGTVAALYPHQWRHLTGASPIAQTYVSPRGAMRVLTGITSFRTSMRFTGVLPEVPAVADSSGADFATLTNYLNAVAGNPMDIRGEDTYWTGKGLGRAARIAEIADQVGNTAVRDAALTAIRARLIDWFTASPGETGRLFYYHQPWGTLIGYPASFGSDQELNDHHFHYGYFIAAAATLAKFDAAWARPDQYGGMVDLLIRDANNYDRGDTRFPYLRDFDIYAGHDWASGHGAFGAGNNQESSSEGMNFANALIQWGQATGNLAVRDAGVFLYTTQAAAIHEYWFDSRNENFPAAFGHSTVGMVWGSGGAYATWFSAEPEMIQGINMLPVTGGHLYFGENPAYVTTNYAELLRNNGGPPTVWQDIIWEFLATGDGDAALANFRANSNFTSEEGESKAHTFHWIRNLAALGTVDTSITANHPLAKVFIKNGARTYVASNITNAPITVTYSNGTTLTVPAGRTVASGAHNWSGGNATGGVNPTGTTQPPTTTTTTTQPPTTTTAPPCSSAPLLSQGQPATASSVENSSYPPANAVDGNPNTRWSSAFSDPQWIRVDLGSVQDLSRVRLHWEAAYGRAYEIQTSVDGSSYTTRASVSNGDGGVDELTISGSGRYVRMYGTQRGTPWGYSLWSLEVYGTCPGTEPLQPTRYLQAGGGLTGNPGPAATVTLAAANGNHDGTPTNPLVFIASGLTGSYTGAAMAFDLFLDTSTVANGTQVRISYDLTGDGTYERVETYRYFATDPVPGWEHYTQAAGLHSSSGALGNLTGGGVRVEVWNAIGTGPTTLGVGDQSRIVLPFT